MIAVAAGVAGKAVVGGAVVGCGDNDRCPGYAPPEVLHAPDLEACPADSPSLEQRPAQRRRRHAVTGLHEVAVAARSADRVGGLHRRVVRHPPRSPLGERRVGDGGGGEVEKDEEAVTASGRRSDGGAARLFLKFFF